MNLSNTVNDRSLNCPIVYAMFPNSVRWGEKGQIYNFLTLILSDRVKLFTLLLGILKNSTDHETRRSSTKYNKDEGK